MAIVVDVISQLENYAITKEALEVLKKPLFSLFHQNESYSCITRLFVVTLIFKFRNGKKARTKKLQAFF